MHLLDGQRVSVRLPSTRRALLVTGQATYTPASGLSIALDGELTTEIRIDESSWNGHIARDHQRGGFLISLDQQSDSPGRLSR